MKTTVRGICWLVVLTVVTLLSPTALFAADENWPTRQALGNLLITQSDNETQTGQVVVYGSDGTLKHFIPLPGTNGEAVHDGKLNAYVANTAPDGTGGIAYLSAASDHTPAFCRSVNPSECAENTVQFRSDLVDSSYVPYPATPNSVAIDRHQIIWVGLKNIKQMPGNRKVGVIQSYAKDAVTGVYVLQQESPVTSDEGAIFIDVYDTLADTFAGPNGTAVVLYTSQGNTVRQKDVTQPKFTLSGQGKAAQLRILNPKRGGLSEIGGVAVGFGTEYRLVTAGGVARSCNFTDSLSPGQRQRNLVELDANPLFWWVGDARSGEWRKLNFKTGCPAAPGSPTIVTNRPSGGAANNGGLRVGPWLSFITFPATSPGVKTPSVAGFLADSGAKGGYTHGVGASVETPAAIKVAAGFVEVDADGICDTTQLTDDWQNDPYQLTDFDCRSVAIFTESESGLDGKIKHVHPPVRQTSRGREHYVWIHEITSKLDEVTPTAKINVSVVFKDALPPDQACPSGDLRATWLLDDPDTDFNQAAGGATPVSLNQFNKNDLGAYFGDPTSTTPPKGSFNHYAAVRAPVAYAIAFEDVTNPVTVGNTLTLTFTVRDATCQFKPDLAPFLNVTIDQGGRPVADRFGYFSSIVSGTGIPPITEQTSAENYKLNLFVDPKIFKLEKNKEFTTFLACGNLDSGPGAGSGVLALDNGVSGVREGCTPFNVKAGGKPPKP